MFNWSQRNFVHITTVTLLWRIQNFIVIGRVHFKPQHCKVWSNFEFHRNIISGTGARSGVALRSCNQVPHSDNIFISVQGGRISVFLMGIPSITMFSIQQAYINDLVLHCSLSNVHDDVIKWKHFSVLLALCGGIHRSPGQWHWALMFSLICTWINGWVNNHEVGDSRCYHAHYDVAVMWYLQCINTKPLIHRGCGTYLMGICMCVYMWRYDLLKLTRPF